VRSEEKDICKMTKDCFPLLRLGRNDGASNQVLIFKRIEKEQPATSNQQQN
jgi:hypothetical protein